MIEPEIFDQLRKLYRGLQGRALTGHTHKISEIDGLISDASWDNLNGKPIVVAAGDTQAQARDSISAVSQDELTTLSTDTANEFVSVEAMVATNTAAINTKADYHVFGISQSEITTPFWFSESEIRQSLQGIKDLGATYVRCPARWADIEPTLGGGYVWTGMDLALDLCDEYGLMPLVAITAPHPAGSSPFVADYGNLCGAIAARYGSLGTGQMHLYQIWNEYNHAATAVPFAPGGAAYVNLLNAASTAIRAADPEAFIMTCGFMSTIDFGATDIAPSTFMNEIYTAGGAAYFDAVAYHWYTHNGDFVTWQEPTRDQIFYQELVDTRAEMVTFGDSGKQIWITEIGQPLVLEPAVRARRLIEQIELVNALDYVEHWVIYNYRPGNDTPTPDAFYPLVGFDFQPHQPIYNFVKSINSVATKRVDAPSAALITHTAPMSPNPYPDSDITSYTRTQTEPVFTSMKVLGPDDVGRFRIGGTLNDNVLAGQFFNLSNGQADNAASYNSFEVEFYLSGDRFGVGSFVQADGDTRMFVDDMPVDMSWPQWPWIGGGGWIEIVFATSRIRKIRVLFGNNSFAGVWLPGASDIWAAEPRYKVAMIGDDNVFGTPDTTEGVIYAGAASGALAMQTGWEVWNLGQGNTGYISDGGGGLGRQPYGHATRIAALVAADPDLVIVAGSEYDPATSAGEQTALQQAAATCWDAIGSALPGVPIVVVGVWTGTPLAFNTAVMDNANTVLRAAAEAHPNVLAYIDQRGEEWFTGTGYVGTEAGNGNQDFFMSSDGVHPSHAGFDYLARRIVNALKRI